MGRRFSQGSAAALLAAIVVVLVGVLVACSYIGAPRPSVSDTPPLDAPPASSTSAPASRAPRVPSPPPSLNSSSSPDTTPTSASLPEGAQREFTNPNGSDPADFAADGYPFIEAARLLPTFSSIWVDDNQRDFHIAVTGDIDGAIEEIRDDVPRGITIYFHLNRYTNAEVCALLDSIFKDRDALMQVGIVITFASCGNKENRVTIGMVPSGPEAVAYMRARYEGPIDYQVGAGSSALRPFVPPDVGDVSHVSLRAIRETDDLGLSSCGRTPFPTAAIKSPTVDLNGPGHAVDALSDSLAIYRDVYGDLSTLDWRLVQENDFGATFLAKRGDAWLEATVYAGKTEWAPGTIDACVLRAVTAADGGDANLYWDPDYPRPGPASTELHLLVEEIECAGGTSPASRLLPPIVRFDESSVHLTIRVRSIGGTCPSNPRLPITVVLPESVGERDVVGVSKEPRY